MQLLLTNPEIFGRYMLKEARHDDYITKDTLEGMSEFVIPSRSS
jgi:hypothetical protein